MVDIVDAQTRSQMMSKIRGKNTKPELVLRKALHARGFRFRLHVKGVPGKPDIVFPKYRAVAFVHGCFWHRHTNCKYATIPKTRVDFWQKKFAANVSRDAAVREMLMDRGWRIATVWECTLRNAELLTRTTDELAKWLTSKHAQLEINE